MSAPYKLGKLTRRRTDGSRYTDIVIKWVDEAGPHRVSLGTPCRIAAAAAAKRFWEQRTVAKSDTIGDIVSAYLDTLDGHGDEARKRNRWGKMKPFWGDLTLADVTIDTTRKLYPEWRNRAVNTLRNELSLLSAAFKWAMKEKGWITAMPLLHWPKQPESKVGHLTKAQFRTFLDSCVMPHVALFAMLAVATGGRKTAILQAKLAYVDWERNLIDLNGGNLATSNKGRATVPLGDRIMDKLREARDGNLSEYIIEHGGEPIKDIKKGVAAASVRSGIHCTPHMFRHSAAVWMAEDRVPMSEIAAFLGHKDSRITERVYARYCPDYLRQASKSLEW